MKYHLLGGVVVATAIASTGLAQRTSIGLTSGKLGLGNVEYNSGNTVSPDVAGKFFTSPTTGKGSVLLIQRSGLAGGGTITDPLLARVTARTHLDVTIGLPAVSDFQAGVLYMSKDGGGGLGVRAFTVNNAGLRMFSGGYAKIEGSKDVSGGNDSATYNASSPNGAPHVDEDVTFEYMAAAQVRAKSLQVTLNKFSASSEGVYYRIETTNGKSFEGMVKGNNSAFFTKNGTAKESYLFNLSGQVGLSAGDVASKLIIRAVNSNPSDTSLGTKEHFLIDGFSYEPVPEPATLAVLGLGAAAMLRRRRNKA